MCIVDLSVAQWMVHPPATRLNPLALYICGGMMGDMKPPLLTSSLLGGSHRIACNVPIGPVAFAYGSASPVAITVACILILQDEVWMLIVFKLSVFKSKRNACWQDIGLARIHSSRRDDCARLEQHTISVEATLVNLVNIRTPGGLSHQARAHQQQSH